MNSFKICLERRLKIVFLPSTFVVFLVQELGTAKLVPFSSDIYLLTCALLLMTWGLGMNPNTHVWKFDRIKINGIGGYTLSLTLLKG